MASLQYVSAGALKNCAAVHSVFAENNGVTFILFIVSRWYAVFLAGTKGVW